MPSRNGAQKTLWIFDFDGTLVDSMTHFTDLASTVMTQYYDMPERLAREQYRQTSGLPFHVQMEQLFPGDARNTVAVTAYETAKAADYLTMPPFPDVGPALDALRARGATIAVSSNNFQHLVEAYVAHHRLPADWVCGWRPDFAKGPAHFAYLLTATGHSREATCFVGDSLKDVRMAQAFGIDCVARIGTFTHEELRAADPDVHCVTTLGALV